MVEKALIRIGCILFALVVVTACAIYLSSNNVNEQNNDNTTYEKSQTFANNKNEEISSNNKKSKKQKTKPRKKSSNKNKKGSKENASHNLEDIMDITNDPTIPETIVYFEKSSKSSNVSSNQNNLPSSSSPDSSKPPSSSLTTSSKPSSFPNEETNPSKPEIIITPKINNELAKKISQKNNIQIIIARAENDYYLNEKNYITDEKLIYNSLNSLSEFLSSIPMNCLNEIGINSIVLCFEHSNKNVFIEQKNSLMFDCNRKYLSTYIKNDIKLFFLQKFLETVDMDAFKGTFKQINPKEFYYGNINKRLIYSNTNILNGYFLNQKSQNSEIDDLTEIFILMIYKPQQIQAISKQSKLYEKIEIAYNLIIEQYPYFKKYCQLE